MLLGLMFIANAQNAAPQATTATDGTLTVTFSTNNAGTSSLTYYVDAIYILNSSGSLVNTLLYNTNNGDSSAGDLPGWYALIGSAWTTSATKLLTTTDAITGATKTSFYSNQIVYWGKKNSVAGIVDGTYTVKFEICNSTSGGGSLTKHAFTGTFLKGPTAIPATSVAATLGFSGITLAWAPVVAGIENIEFSKLYNVYPNPAISSIYASGNDIKEVHICSLAGKVLLTSKLQNVNVSTLPKGAYLAVIYAKDGMVVKKIEKL